MDRVVEEVGEVRIEIEFVALDIDHAVQAAQQVAAAGRQDVARGVPAVGLVDRVEIAQPPILDRAARDLIGGVPVGVVGQGGDRPASDQGAAQEVDLLQVLRRRPGAARGRDVCCDQHVLAQSLGADGAVIVVLADPGLQAIAVQVVGGLEGDGAGGGEVAVLGRVGTLLEADVVHELRRQDIEVEIALAVPVARQVQRHAVQRGREVRAVVKIETAEEILVGLARARVLGRGQARYGLDQLARTQQRPHGEVGVGDAALAGRRRAAEVVGAATPDRDRLDLLGLGENRRRGGGEQGDQKRGTDHARLLGERDALDKFRPTSTEPCPPHQVLTAPRHEWPPESPGERDI